MIFQPQIQGLRTLAVLAVLGFHLWPQYVPGGYVGVDVFFVISGYLITGLLLSRQEQGLIGIAAFFLGRARRLLPAATVVLLITAICSTIVLPPAQIMDAAAQIVGSALYVENWRLAALAVDYLAAENAPGPAQQFWTLAVEWQFYAVYPFLLLGLNRLAKRFDWQTRHVIVVALIILATLSLTLSIVQTQLQPEIAYFSTFTRIWQFGFGALLAVLGQSPPRQSARLILRFGGLAAIAAACFLFSATTAYPGYAALLPTSGAAMIIASGNVQVSWITDKLLMSRPTQYIGEISYSLYLWHWPILIFSQAAFPGPMSLGASLLILTTSLLLAIVTNRLVEYPFRQKTWSSRPAFFQSAILLPLAALPIALSLLIDFSLRSDTTSAATLDAKLYPGYQSLLLGAPAPDVPPMPPVASVKQDRFTGYDTGCHLGYTKSEPNPCRMGQQDGDYKVMVLGDSHATNWLPALELIANQRHWQLTSNTMASCAPLEVMLMRGERVYENCLEWSHRVADAVRTERPDLVIWSKSTTIRLADDGSGESEAKRMRAAMRQFWKELEDTGAQVIAIADTPRMSSDLTACAHLKSGCSTPLKDALQYDPILQAQQSMPSVGLVTMTDTLCNSVECPAVVGNIIVWRDMHHLTATYSRNLAPVLAERLDAAIASSASRAIDR